MFGFRLRADNKRLRRLAEVRADLLNEQRTLVGILTGNQTRQIKRRRDLMAIVAMHYEAGTTLDHLRCALHTAGFDAELDMALRDLAGEEVTS